MRKFLVFLLVLLTLVVLGLLVSVRFFPQLYVSAFNKLSPEKISFNTLDVSYFPLAVEASGFDLKDSDGAKLVTVENLSLTTKLLGLLQGKRNFWKADLADVDVQLYQFPESAEDDSGSDIEAVQEAMNVHQVLSGLNFQIGDVRIQLDEHSYVNIKTFNTGLNNDDLSDFTLIEQALDFSLDYVELGDVEKKLTIDGVLQSKIEAGVSKLKVVIPSVDLRTMFPLSSEGAEQPQADVVQSNENENSDEDVVDWQWLSSFDPLELDLSIGEVLWSKSNFRDVATVLTFDESISFTQQVKVTWLDSESFSFDDEISFSGQWQPTSTVSSGADLRGQAEFKTSDLTLNVDGEVNVNGMAGNDLSIKLVNSKVPFKSPSLDNDTLVLLEQYFPIDIAVNVKQTEQLIELNIDNAQFGQSDIKGTVELKSEQAELLDITTQLESTLISYITPEELQASTTEKAERDLQPLPVAVEGQEELPTDVLHKGSDSKTEQLFTSESIDWSWLDGLNVDFDWKSEQVRFDDIEVNKLSFPLKISDSKLVVNDAVGNFAGGSFKMKSELTKQGESGLLNFNLDVSDVVLEKLNLLPPEELKKGVTNVLVDLTTQGESSHALASSLNGIVKINVGDGVIGNDSFELIGSDLILSLLNKLNPFAKNNKTTDLECAVVNLKIDEGKINIDKSLALRTSKLTMVANGSIDLGTEKIKLSLTPKARSGVGVDVSSLVKFIALGGTLLEPKPAVTASGLLKSAVVVGAAVSTGGVSLLAASAAEKTVGSVDVCKRATNAFN